MKFSYNWLSEYLDSKIDVQKASELLSLRSFEVEEVIPMGEDSILDIKVLPNRPDALSHAGIARELAALTGTQYKNSWRGLKADLSVPDNFKIKIEHPDMCSRYSGLIIRNVSVGKSPAWLAERLVSLGLKSINNIVDATNYVMLA